MFTFSACRSRRQNRALSLPASFRFCAGGAADISRWWSAAEPPDRPPLLRLRPGRGAGRNALKSPFRDSKPRPAPLPGRWMTAFPSRWFRCAPPPATIHGPFRAKGGKLHGPQNLGKDKVIEPGVERFPSGDYFDPSRTSRISVRLMNLSLSSLLTRSTLAKSSLARSRLPFLR
jgi:hypothetical protein